MTPRETWICPGCFPRFLKLSQAPGRFPAPSLFTWWFFLYQGTPSISQDKPGKSGQFFCWGVWPPQNVWFPFGLPSNLCQKLDGLTRRSSPTLSTAIFFTSGSPFCFVAFFCGPPVFSTHQAKKISCFAGVRSIFPASGEGRGLDGVPNLQPVLLHTDARRKERKPRAAKGMNQVHRPKRPSGPTTRPPPFPPAPAVFFFSSSNSSFLCVASFVHVFLAENGLCVRVCRLLNSKASKRCETDRPSWRAGLLGGCER